MKFVHEAGQLEDASRPLAGDEEKRRLVLGMIRLRLRVIVDQQLAGRAVEIGNLLGAKVALDLAVETVVNLPGTKPEPLEGIIGPVGSRRLVFDAPQVKALRSPRRP